MGVFTETFALDRRAMAEALSLLLERPDILSERVYKSFSDSGHPLGIGWNKVVSVDGWLRASGLISAGDRKAERTVTPLGQLVVQCDPNLSKMITWWLIHIQLSTNPRATVYQQIFNLVSSRPMTRSELRKVIAGESHLKEKSVDNDLTGILGSFSRGGAKLPMLGVLSSEDSVFVRGTPEGLTSGIVGNACYMVRASRSPEALSMDLHTLSGGGGGLTAIFGVPASALRPPLRQLVEPLAQFGFSYTETADLDSVTFGSITALGLAERLYRGELRDDVII